MEAVPGASRLYLLADQPEEVVKRPPAEKALVRPLHLDQKIFPLLAATQQIINDRFYSLLFTKMLRRTKHQVPDPFPSFKEAVQKVDQQVFMGLLPKNVLKGQIET